MRKNKKIYPISAIIIFLTAITVCLSVFSAAYPTGQVSREIPSSFCINNPPSINLSHCNRTAYTYQPYICHVNVTDPDNDSFMFYDDTDLFDIGLSTGIISFLPKTIGVFQIKINVTDITGCINLSDAGYFNLTIYGAPVLEARVAEDNSSVYLNWSNITNAVSYTVYYSSNLSFMEEFNPNTAAQGTANITGITALNWTDTGARSTLKRYYRVSAALQGYENISNTVGKIDINLTTRFGRWNYVSLPFTPPNKNIKAVLRPISGAYDWVYKYRPSDGDWDYYHKTYDIGTIINLDNGYCYLIKATKNTTLTLTGDIFSHVTRNITTRSDGWNYIGWVDEITPRDTGLAAIAGSYGWLYRYRNTDGSWDYYYAPFGIGTISHLYHGQCYIVKAIQNDTLDYDMNI